MKRFHIKLHNKQTTNYRICTSKYFALFDDFWHKEVNKSLK